MLSPRIDLLPGTLEMLVLQTLAIGPQHGYGIARRIQSASREVLHVEEGSLYPALYRMDKRGWLRSEWGPSEANRRARFYRLTPSGKRALERQARDWERMAEAIGLVMKPQG